MFFTRTALVVSSVFALALAFRPAVSQDATPPIPTHGFPSIDPPALAGNGVRAIVVKSWNNGLANGWADLNNGWASYGTTPISIDTNTLGGAASFTYQDLVDSAADVVILSDVAGGNFSYTTAEVAAVRSYAAQGHNLIATFATFFWNQSDNSALAPVFGLAPASGFSAATPPISNAFQIVELNAFLFRGLPGPAWQSAGYNATQSPGDGVWDANDLAGAQIVAQCDNSTAIVSVFRTPKYYAIYFSNMPEYNGVAADRQLLYNAITFPHAGGTIVNHP